MQNNWYIELMKAAKTDPIAQDLVEHLKNATTNEEKEKAKQNGKEYIKKQAEIQESHPETSATTESEVVQEDVVPNQDGGSSDDTPDMPMVQESPRLAETKVVEKKYDMSEPAFNPRLAKMGITREEELFQMHVYVRKLSREEKMEIRRSIYQKKKTYARDVQNKFREERAKKIAALQADPEYQKYQNQQKYVVRIVEALKAHCNIDWMLTNIPGLTVEVIRELLQTPANVNKFKEQKAEFVPNFYKKFGK